MTKFPILHYNTKNTKSKLVPPPMPPSKYEDVVGWPMIEASYKQALRGHRKFSREAVCYPDPAPLEAGAGQGGPDVLRYFLSGRQAL